jgi:metallophosphoesterase (TIGR00282 family)
MRILFLGDVVGRAGRDAIEKHLPELKEKLKTDFVIVNVDNASHGFGVTCKIADDLLALGVDCLTGGDHIWNQKEIIPYIDREKRLIRPSNFPPGIPGQGTYLKELRDGRKILVMHLMGRVFLEGYDDPFRGADEILKRYNLGQSVQAIFVDMHAEATSEKMAIAHYLDGRVSAVVGTHTHVPTADAQILDKGTALQTDAGMCGDYNSVIGFKPDIPIQRFVRKLAVEKMSPNDGEGTVCGTFIETDDKTGLAKEIRPIRIGGRLSPSL